MNVHQFRSAASTTDTVDSVANTFVSHLIANRSDRIRDYARPSTEVFGRAVCANDWGSICAAFSAAGDLKLTALRAAPDGVVSMVEDQETCFGGVVGNDETVVIVDLQSGLTEMSIGLVIDRRRPTRPLVARVFDPINLAIAYAAA